jgi:hypothetical protein
MLLIDYGTIHRLWRGGNGVRNGASSIRSAVSVVQVMVPVVSVVQYQ